MNSNGLSSKCKMQSSKLQFKIQNLIFSFKFLVVVFSFSLFVFSFVVYATSEADITFPVAELGNCKNKQECKAYCNQSDHIRECVAFAKKHNLLSQKEIKRAEVAAELPPGGGPGGCATLQECASYCGTVDHIQECLAFGKKHGLMEEKELEEAEKVEKILREGKKLPGGCTSKDQCEVYCNEEEHMDECIEFGRKAGFMSEEEYQIAKKTGGRGPGGCRGRECERYCEDESHFDECLAFAKEHGLISDKEHEMAKKSGGKGPGGCRGRACKNYCENPDHFEECLNFGKEQGFISEKEYEMAKKTGGKGPGGCFGEACRTYCDDPTHEEECINFAKEHGLIHEEDIKRMEESAPGGKKKGDKPFGDAPPEVQACIESALGEDFMEQKRKGLLKPQEMEAKVRVCFEQYGKPQGMQENMPGSQEFHEGDFPSQSMPPQGTQPHPPAGGFQPPPGFVPPNSPPPSGGSGEFPPPQEFHQPQSNLHRFGATLINTLQFLMGR